MRTANKKEDVRLQAIVQGTEKVERTRCEHCYSYYDVYSGGENRCQFVLLNKSKLINYKGMFMNVTYYSQCVQIATESVNNVWYCLRHSKIVEQEIKTEAPHGFKKDGSPAKKRGRKSRRFA